MAGKEASYERVLGLRRNITNWELGYHKPTETSMRSLADALEVPFETILALYPRGGSGGGSGDFEIARFLEWAVAEYRRKTAGVTA
jgi:transcriptional regulator with XRE-family HTH domain